MKAKTILNRILSGLVALLLGAVGLNTAQAGTATKQSTGTDLTGGTPGVWSGGSGLNGSPTSTDVALWVGTSLGLDLTLGASESWSGIIVSGALSDVGITGGGTLTLGTGGITLSTVNMTIATPVALGAGQAWTVTGTGLTNSGTVSGSGQTLTLGGSGTVSLSGAGSQLSVLDVNNGTLALTGGDLTILGNFQMNASGATPETLNVSGGSLTVKGTSFGTGNNSAGAANATITQTGGSILYNNTTSGQMAFANWGGTTTVTLSGGTLTCYDCWGPVLSERGTSIVTITNSGSAYFAQGPNSGGAGLQLAGQSGSICTLNLGGGILVVPNFTEGKGTGTLNFNGGTLQAMAASTSFMTGLTAATVLAGGAIINDGGYAITIAQPLLTGGAAHDGGLTKLNSGTLTLSGANTYTGETTVSSGTLLVNGTLAAGSAVTVQANGTLGGTGTINGTVTNNGTLSPGASSAGVLTINGALALAGNSTNKFRLNKGGTSDQVMGTSGVSYGGTLKVTLVSGTLALWDSFQLFNNTTYNGAFAATNLPALGSGWVWDTNGLTVNGSIQVSRPGWALPPVFSPVAGGYIGAQTVTIMSVTPGATIYYTTDGTMPTNTSPSGVSPVTVTVPVNTTMTIQAYASASGYTNCQVVSATYATEAGSAIWISASGGSWATGSDWLKSIIPNASGVTADFSQLELTSDTVVTLDGTWTIGNLIFEDLGNKYTWEIEAGTGGTLALAATNSPTITVLNQTTTITAALAGTNGLTKVGPGTLSLTGVNTYSGGTIISNGTVATANFATLGAGPITIGTNGTYSLTTTDGNQPTFANAVSGRGVFNVTGSSGNQSFWSGDWSGFSGTLSITTNTGWWAELANTGSTAIRMNLSGSARMYDNESNITRTYNIGELTGGAGSRLGGQPNTSNNLTLSVGALGTSTTFAGVIDNNWQSATDTTSTTGLTKVGAGTLSLTGTNTYSGGTIISNGTVATANFATLGAGPITIGTNGTYSLTTTGGNQPTFTNAVSGRGVFNVTGSSGNQSFWSGDWSGFSGTLSITTNTGWWAESANTGSTAMRMNLSGSARMYNNETGVTRTYNIGELTGGAGSVLGGQPDTGNNVTLSVGALGTSTTYAGVIDNNWQNALDTTSTTGLTKVGAGTLTLSGVSFYTGDTTVSNGTLLVNGAIGNLAVGFSAVTVQSGGTLGGNGAIGGSVAVNAGGTLTAGANSVVGTLTIANTLTLNAGSTTMLKLNQAAATNDSLAGINTLTYGGTLTVTNLAGTLASGNSFKLFSATASAGDFDTLHLPALRNGLAWNWTPTNGTLSVVGTVITPPVLSSVVTFSKGSFSLSFSGPNGQNYTVLMTTNLALPLADWTDLINGTFGASAADFTDTSATNAARFYRIMSQ